MCLGVPGRILAVRLADGLRMADVDFGGARREVCLAYVPEAEVGDYVVVHVGFAISRVSESEARETLALLAEIEALELPGSSRLPGS
jgi:hydrogenase expression/formation protein HypC